MVFLLSPQVGLIENIQGNPNGFPAVPPEGPQGTREEVLWFPAVPPKRGPQRQREDILWFSLGSPKVHHTYSAT